MAKSPKKSNRKPTSSSEGEPPDDEGFDQPGESEESEGQDLPSDQGEFDAPVEAEMDGDDESIDAAEMEVEADDDLVALKSELEKKLAANANTATEAESIQEIEGSNIVGVGLGTADPEALAAEGSQNMLPGETGLVCFTVEPCSNEQLASEISSVAGTSALSSLPVLQVPVGIVDAFSHRMRMRPAPGGISVGHQAITAGTLGCLVRGTSAPRNRRLMILSNNHVLANSSNARLGDCIAQPGPFDGGRCNRDRIAILERFIRINFRGGTNYVDCATGWAWPNRVRRELMYLRGTTPRYFRVGARPVAPRPGMLVGKTGRTTQLRSGRITAVGVSVNVNFGGGRIAHFRDQIAIRGTTSAGFSAGGDSGSLIWEWRRGLAPVGLLFAGGGGTTFGNRIGRVLSALRVRMYN